jgi:hypothetical protein
MESFLPEPEACAGPEEKAEEKSGLPFTSGLAAAGSVAKAALQDAVAAPPAPGEHVRHAVGDAKHAVSSGARAAGDAADELGNGLREAGTHVGKAARAALDAVRGGAGPVVEGVGEALRRGAKGVTEEAGEAFGKCDQ